MAAIGALERDQLPVWSENISVFAPEIPTGRNLLPAGFRARSFPAGLGKGDKGLLGRRFGGRGHLAHGEPAVGQNATSGTEKPRRGDIRLHS